MDVMVHLIDPPCQMLGCYAFRSGEGGGFRFCKLTCGTIFRSFLTRGFMRLGTMESFPWLAYLSLSYFLSLLLKDGCSLDGVDIYRER